jgi:hypothetical protein
LRQISSLAFHYIFLSPGLINDHRFAAADGWAWTRENKNEMWKFLAFSYWSGLVVDHHEVARIMRGPDQGKGKKELLMC